jgi:hypothetical protein
MRKARILLVAVALFTVAGATMAVKAHRFGGLIFGLAPTTVAGIPTFQCTLPLFDRTITTTGVALVNVAPVPVPLAPCPPTFITTAL